jgi:hypothetical protein
MRNWFLGLPSCYDQSLSHPLSWCHIWSAEGTSSMVALGRDRQGIQGSWHIQEQKVCWGRSLRGLWSEFSLTLSSTWCRAELTFCFSAIGKGLTSRSRVRWRKEHCGAVNRPGESWPGPGDPSLPLIISTQDYVASGPSQKLFYPLIFHNLESSGCRIFVWLSLFRGLVCFGNGWQIPSERSQEFEWRKNSSWPKVLWSEPGLLWLRRDVSYYGTKEALFQFSGSFHFNR